MFKNISVKDALKLAYEGKALLYDLRTQDAYAKGHLPLARNFESNEMEEELKKNIDLHRKGVLVVLYCDYGNQSMRVAKELSDKGYQRIASIVGGYQAYEGYVEAQKKDFWTMEWKERGTAGEKEVDSQSMDK